MPRPPRTFPGRRPGAIAARAALVVALAACARAASSGSGDTVVPVASRPSAGSTANAPTDTTALVTLATDAVHYPANAKVGLTLTNRTESRYSFNPCSRIVERESGAGDWAAVTEAGRMCTMEAWILDVRGTRTATTDLPAALPEGRYRIVIELTREGGPPPSGRVRAVSAAFHAGA